MHRRALTLLAMIVVAAIAVGACGGSTPALSDPTEILTRSVETLQKAKTVHFEATVDGTVKLDLTGTGQGGDIALTGTSLTADLDIANGDATMSLAVPAMLGLTADVIVVGEDSYTRTSFTGDKYQKGSAAAAGLPVDAADPQQSLKKLQDWLKKPEVAPKKLADASCASKTCYQVEIDLSAEDLAALAPDLTDLGDATVLLTVLVEKDTLRPVSVDVKVTSTEVGDVSLALALSKWDEAVSITAPSADQIQ